MPEIYDEIINEIEQRDKGADNYLGYLNDHGLRIEHQWMSTDMVLDIAARVREAVSGDPSEWWVEDADGNRLKIGDKFKHYDNTEYEVFALGPERVIYDIGHFFNSVRADLVHKVTPDTREKIIDDTLAKLVPYGVGGGKVAEAIEDAVDRAMKLPEVDA